jgi:hypothetical protein
VNRYKPIRDCSTSPITSRSLTQLEVFLLLISAEFLEFSRKTIYREISVSYGGEYASIITLLKRRFIPTRLHRAI